MNKKFMKIILMILCIVITVGCSAGEKQQKTKNTISFTDDFEREVNLPGKPERTAVLIGSFASVWTLAGGEMVATSNNAWTDFDLALSDDVVNIGTTSHASLEKLLQTNPDFIIASTKTKLDVDWKEIFEEMKIPVAYFDVTGFDDYLRMLDICTDITGRKDLYKKNGEDVKEKVQKELERADGSNPSVLYLRASASGVKAKDSSKSVLGEMLKNAGCINIADSDKTLPEDLSIEKIVTADPDYIFIVKQGSDQEKIEEGLKENILSHPLWKELTAVKENRLYFMDQSLYNYKPNNRWGEAYEKLMDILYPEK